MTYSAKEVAQLKAWRDQGLSFAEISRRTDGKRSRSAVRHLLQRAPKAKKEIDRTALANVEERRRLQANERGNNQRVLVISDLHAPFQHPDAVAFLAALKAKYRPTRVVCMGDEIDQHNLSFHDTDPDLPGPADELKAAINELKPLYKLFPRVDLIDSNHGSMIYRRGKHHGIPRKYLRDYGEVLDAPKGWVWHNELIVDLPDGNKCFFHHGLSKDVMKVVALRGMCVVQGHYHTEFRIGYISNPAALLWGMNTGCLINRRSLAFAYDNTNLGRPVIGLGIIIDGRPQLLPMPLDSNHRWTGVVP